MATDIHLVYVMAPGERVRLFPNSRDGSDELVAVSDNPDVLEIDAHGWLTARDVGTAVIQIEGGSPASLSIRVLDEDLTAPDVTNVRPRLRFDADRLDDQRALFARSRNDASAPLHNDVVSFFETADGFVTETTFAHTYEIGGESRHYSGQMPFAMPGPLEQPLGFTDYPFWTALSRLLEQRLVTLSAAYVISGERKYGDAARTQLLSLCAWQKWHEYDIATNNLSLPHFAIAVGYAYDEIYDLLTPDERAAVREAIVMLGLRPMTFWHRSEFDHNINVLMNVGMLIGSLAIADEYPDLGMFIHAPRDTMLWYMDQRLNSAESEGHTYVCYAMNYLLRGGLALRSSCGDACLLDHPFSQTELPDFLAHFYAGESGMAPLADSYTTTDPVPTAVMMLRESDDQRFRWLVRHRKEPLGSMLPFVVSEEQILGADDPGLPTSALFEKFGWAALRDGWAEGEALVTFTSSPSTVGHTHFDQNNVVINVESEWLLTDPGYQVYSPGPEGEFTRETVGHNSLLVNDQGQHVRGKGHIAAYAFDDGYSYLVGDATDAYEGRIERWQRHLLMRHRRYVVLVDVMATVAAEDRLELMFHTTSRIVREKSGSEADPSPWRFQGGRGSLTFEFASPTTYDVTVKSYPGAERYGEWISVSLSGERHYVLTTLISLSPDSQRVSLAGVEVGDDEIQVALRCDDRQSIHRFARNDPFTHQIEPHAPSETGSFR